MNRLHFRQFSVFAVLVLAACTLSGCKDKPVGGGDVDQGPVLLRYPRHSAPYVYYEDIGGGGYRDGIFRIDLSSDEPTAELIVEDGMFPDISPSGTRLAYVLGGLHVMDLETRESERIVPGDVILPKWFGEDTLVYEIFAGEIYVVDVDVAVPRRILEEFASFPDISASGMVVFADGLRIAEVDLSGSNIRDLFAYPDPYESVAYPDWSPTGREIVFEYWAGSFYEIRALSISDSLVEVRDLAQGAKYPTFSGDGESILYVKIDEGLRRKFNGQIWIMDAEDGSGKQQLTFWEMMRDSVASE